MWGNAKRPAGGPYDRTTTDPTPEEDLHDNINLPTLVDNTGHDNSNRTVERVALLHNKDEASPSVSIESTPCNTGSNDNAENPSLQLQPESFSIDTFDDRTNDNDNIHSTVAIRSLHRARILLYLSHFFAQFSEGAWQFSLVLFLAAVSHYKSLVLLSTYGITSFAAVCLAGARVGHFVDSAHRLTAARWLIGIENMAVIVSSALCYVLFRHVREVDNQQLEDTIISNNDDSSLTWWETYLYGIPKDIVSVSLLVGIHVFGSLAQILDQGFLVAIERDWIVVMSTQSPINSRKAWLSQTNVTLKQIDLSCKIVAPAVAGFVVGSDGDHLSQAAVWVGLLNVLALVVEYLCTYAVYRLVPALATSTVVDSSRTQSISSRLEDDEDAELPVSDDDIHAQAVELKNASQQQSKSCQWCFLPRGLSIYVQQPIAWGGLGLSLLYLNALTFGGLMTAFLVYRGLSVERTGVWRGISSAMGLMGTFVYHVSVKYRTLVQTGQWSVVYLFICSSVCFVSFFVSDFEIAMAMLLIGACCSRIGLWVFDITITQLMQEFIPDGIRGTVGGAQQSLNAFFQLLSFSLGLIFPDPGNFFIIVGAGNLSIGVALVLYTLGVSCQASRFRMPTER
jgi:iron-regulated transporter 1